MRANVVENFQVWQEASARLEKIHNFAYMITLLGTRVTGEMMRARSRRGNGSEGHKVAPQDAPEQPQVSADPDDDNPHWKDSRFVSFADAIAKSKGMTSLHSAAATIGMGSSFAPSKSSGRGRRVDSIIRLAEALGVDPLDLIRAGLPDRYMPTEDGLRRLGNLASAANIAAYLYVALDQGRTLPASIDPKQIIDAIKRLIEDEA